MLMLMPPMSNRKKSRVLQMRNRLLQVRRSRKTRQLKSFLLLFELIA